MEQQKLWKFIQETLPEFRNFLEKTDVLSSGEDDRAILNFLRILTGSPLDGMPKDDFLSKAARKILAEWDNLALESPGLVLQAEAMMDNMRDSTPAEKEEALLAFLFPEKTFAGGGADDMIREVRKRRTVTLKTLNPAPLKDPASELLFSSNVLLTLPPQHYYEKLNSSLKERTRAVSRESQQYWFDHPILMGVDTDANEMIYGLRGLAETLKYEKERGNAAADARMTVILSLSVTHNGLKDLAHEYLGDELKKAGSPEGLNVYLFSEEDTRFLSDQLGKLSDLPGAAESISAVFGVDGHYGRHYSFLKALAPLWTLVMDKQVKGTFKIDLDQVFPQNELVEETGKSAFDHFMTPLWGARGVDSRGREISLGMIAGALVNEKDIKDGLFTPDVPLPDPNVLRRGETRIFDKQQVMASSTRGEMMTLYDENLACISRVHVTGGTNGILCDTLRQYRPFTPGFIGRAEDQAYILSVLLGNPAGDQEGALLRYVHEPGLIMRHDKEAFAGDAIAAAKLGTSVGDLLRQLYFSFYARFLPGGVSAAKEELDPFTGCYITHFPYTMVFLRLILKVLDEPENRSVLLDMASRRLGEFTSEKNSAETVKTLWMGEREGWDLYYDALDLLESGMNESSDLSEEISGEIRKRMERCRIS